MSTRVRSLSPKKRKDILESAVQVFSERGFEGASMDKIAEEAHVSKITIYKHFQSKEALFIVLVSEYLQENKNLKPTVYLSTETLEAQLMKFIHAELFRVTDPKQRGLSRLLTSVYLYRADLVKDTMRENPFFTEFIGWLHSAKEDGKIYYENEYMTALTFYGLIQGCLTWNALLTDGESLDQVESVVEEILTTFLARYKSIEKE